MKVLQVSATDTIGGAGIAAYRLQKGLQAIEVDVEMLVYRKASPDPSIHRILPRMSRWQRLQTRYAMRQHSRILKQYPRKPDSAYWNLNHKNYPIAEVINSFQADVVHVHWIGDNYLPIQQLEKINAPIVWTLHDMWGFTGGCHYAADCTRYTQHCGSCPQLEQSSPEDISHQINNLKAQSWQNLPVTIVCPSHWLADCARQSNVFKDKRVEVIANGIDQTVFKPLDKATARKAFNLPPDKKLILFGAFGGTSDPRKGFNYLVETLKLLSQRESSGIELVTLGANQPQDLDTAFPLHQIMWLNDTVSMALLYSAMDVVVVPSVQEAFGQMASEAFACGVPVVAFGASGLLDILDHQVNGYLAQPYLPDDLAKGIQWVLEDEERHHQLSQQAYQKAVKAFDIRHIAEQYHALYQELT